MEYVVVPIATMFDCKVNISKYRHGTINFGFFGTDKDMMFCEYMYYMIRNVIDKSAASYDSYELRSQGYATRTILNSYRLGMASRIAVRLQELKNEMNGTANGITSLMVIKGKLVEEKYHERFGNLKKRNGQKKSILRSSYQQGYADGGNVNLSKAVNV